MTHAVNLLPDHGYHADAEAEKNSQRPKKGAAFVNDAFDGDDLGAADPEDALEEVGEEEEGDLLGVVFVDGNVEEMSTFGKTRGS